MDTRQPDYVGAREFDEAAAKATRDTARRPDIRGMADSPEKRAVLAHENAPEGGAKHDDLKLRVDLVPPELTYAVSLPLTFGLAKYGAEGGWKRVPEAMKRYLAAIERHLLAIKAGEALDQESGLPHDFHLACDAAFRCHFIWKAMFGQFSESVEDIVAETIRRGAEARKA